MYEDNKLRTNLNLKIPNSQPPKVLSAAVLEVLNVSAIDLTRWKIRYGLA